MQYIKYLQTPYKHHGRDFSGCDCFGLVRLFYNNELGTVLPDFEESYEEEWWHDHDYILEFYKTFNFKKVNTFEFGNVIVFRNTTNRVGHLGIVISDSMFIHMTSKGCAIENYIYGPYARQIHSVYKLKKTKPRKKAC